MKSKQIFSQTKTYKAVSEVQSGNIVKKRVVRLSDDDIRLKIALQKAVKKDFAPERLREKLNEMLRQPPK